MEGQTEWALPFGWGITFPTTLSLDPGQSMTRNLQIDVPTSQEPGTFVIYLKGWSTGEPVLSVDKGTFDILELWVNVSIKSTGNIVFDLTDDETQKQVLPGECSEFEIEVTKHFTPGHLVFTTPGGPDEKPDEVSEQTWRFDHWTVNLDFSEAPGGNSIPEETPRYWAVVDLPYKVTAEMCAPFNATAGIGDSVTVKATLDGAPKVRDSVVLVTNVIQRYDLEATSKTILSLYPGQEYQLDTGIKNTGNGADRYEIAVGSITDQDGNADVWDIVIPRILFEELDRDESQLIPIIINVPEQTLAGQYTVVLEIFSEESFEGTKLRDLVTLQVEIVEFHDMRITVDPTVESRIKTTAPGRVVRFTMNVTNFGNVADQPTVHNHTVDGAGWDVVPGLNTLGKWNIEYALLEGFGSEYPVERPCVVLMQGDPIPSEECFKDSKGRITLPEMPSYTTLQLVAIVTIDPEAALADREIGIKLKSSFGDSVAGGDFDETPIWEDSCTIDMNGDGLPDNYRPNCDTNEQVLELRLRAPDLQILETKVGDRTGQIGDMLSVTVSIFNDGNSHATDVNVILCVDQSVSSIKKDGCKESNVVYRQLIEAIMPTRDGDEPPLITLLYLVEAGTHEVVVVVDPENIIVETDERNNYQSVGDMGSNNGILDVGVEVIALYSVPAIILGATFALISVAGVVMYGRRIEALDRFAEKSSMLSNLDDESDTEF